MDVGIYAHPRDLLDLEGHGGMARLVELGFTELALAAAYHAGRWLTPWSSAGPVRFLEDGVVHFRPRGRYGELQPCVSREVPARGASPIEDLIERARGAGVRSVAWTVLFHNSRLGRARPDLCVANAFGDAYTYALCPAREAVSAYGRQIVDDLAAHTGLGAIELEAAGFMGHRHGSHHDKSSFATEPYTDFLLSYCFCESCSTGLGPGAAAIRAAVAARIVEHRRDTDAMTAVAPQSRADARERLIDDLGADVVATMLAHRERVYRRTLAELRDVVDGRCALALHMSFDWTITGSALGAPLELAAGHVDEVVSTHYGERPSQIDAAWQGQPTDRVAVRAAVWPKAPQFQSDDDLVELRAVLERHRAVGMRVYHLGLLPWKTIERVAGAFRQSG